MPTQVSGMLGSILRSAEAKELPCGVFGSYGWSGEAVDILRDRLKDAGFQSAFKPIKIAFRPDALALQVLLLAQRFTKSASFFNIKLIFFWDTLI